MITFENDMNKRISKQVEVSTRVRYLPEHSNAMEHSFFFMYTITIVNNSDQTVKLISRHWDIFDSSGDKKVVEGEGVIGEQPIIEPGKSYSYSSGCGLTTDIGRMSGYYTMIRVSDGHKFKVPIAAFELYLPYRLN